MGIGAVYAAENIDPDNDDSQYAYGENVGWLNFEPGGDGGSGAEVTDTAVIGYAWAENIGWINLSPTSFGGVVNNGSGMLSGFAWSENVGWINFGPIGGGVTITNGDIDGWAWGENIGWIHFQSPAVPYVVRTSWPEGGVCTLPNDLDGDCDIDRNDLKIILAARNTPATGPDDPRDLNGDGNITVHDAWKLMRKCTRSRCATE